jgi:cob(I)alamin adenosyltransferase
VLTGKDFQFPEFPMEVFTMTQGLIHLYHGDGKGKTTAAMGLALRAAGGGFGVWVVQFLKGGASGEISLLERLPNVRVLHDVPGVKFSWQMDDAERASARRTNDGYLARAIAEAAAGACDLLVLDEAVGACGCGLLDEERLLDFMRRKPAGLELVITGRDPSRAMLESADYVTEMKKQRHPYDQGVNCRVGVEF